jgi:hypothetical protein
MLASPEIWILCMGGGDYFVYTKQGVQDKCYALPLPTYGNARCNGQEFTR